MIVPHQTVVEWINKELHRCYLDVELEHVYSITCSHVKDSSYSLFGKSALAQGLIDMPEDVTRKTDEGEVLYHFIAYCDRKQVIGMIAKDPRCFIHETYCKLLIDELEEVL